MNVEVIKENLKRLREATGKSQVEVANELMGFQKQTISKYENGYTIPPIDRLIDLANYYHVTLDDLVNKKLYLEDRDIILDKKLFMDYFSMELYDKDFSNIIIKQEMFFKSMKTNIAIIDSMDEDNYPYIEYLSEHGFYDLSDLNSLFNCFYEKKLDNAVIHTSNKLISLEEQIGLVYGLGGSYDFLKKPSSIALDISDTFLVLCKLVSRGKINDSGKIVIDLDYRDLILYDFADISDLFFCKPDKYAEVEKELKKILEKKYNEEYMTDMFAYPIEGYNLLLYLKEFEKELPETLNDLIEITQNITLETWGRLAIPYKKAFVTSILDQIFPDVFKFNIKYKLKSQNAITGGINANIRNSTKLNSSASLVNFIIAENYNCNEFKNIWDRCLSDYFNERDLTWLIDGFDSKRQDFISIRSLKTDKQYLKYFLDYIKSTWNANNMHLLDAKTFRLVKSLVRKRIVD